MTNSTYIEDAIKTKLEVRKEERVMTKAVLMSLLRRMEVVT